MQNQVNSSLKIKIKEKKIRIIKLCGTALQNHSCIVNLSKKLIDVMIVSIRTAVKREKNILHCDQYKNNDLYDLSWSGVD